MKPCFTPLLMGNVSDVSGGRQHLEHNQLLEQLWDMGERLREAQFTRHP